MATRMINEKIPNNFRVRSKLARRDAVASADSVAPSVHGIAARGIAGIVSRASTIADGIALISVARKVAAKTGDAELAAIANNPKLSEAIDGAIRTLAKSADSLLRDYNAEASDAPESLTAGTPVVNHPMAGAPSAVSGQDTNTKIAAQAQAAMEVMQREIAKGKTLEEARESAREFVKKQRAGSARATSLDAANVYTAWTPEAIAKREKLSRAVADMGSAIEFDTTQNAVRARFGLSPVSVDGDALYELFGDFSHKK